MTAKLFNQLRLLMKAWRGDVAGVRVPGLLKAWLKLATARTRPGQRYDWNVGGLVLSAPNADEARFLAIEIFLSTVYGPALDKEAPRILDCGANCGFATAFFKLLHPRARITAFEPSPRSFALLNHNLKANRFLDVETVNAACGSGEGVLEFVESGHLSLISSADRARAQGNKVTVPMVPLSRWVDEQVDLLKLDVEGAEHEILDELMESGRLPLVRRMAIEYHHRMGTPECRLGQFLTRLEREGFTYSLAAGEAPGVRFGAAFQDIMIYAHRTNP